MGKQKICIIEGDGIGPEITASVLKVSKALNLPFEFIWTPMGEKALNELGSLTPEQSLNDIEKYKVALKGPLATPIGKGFKSINVTLRQKFKLFANVRPAISFEGTKSKYENIDITIFRENTEGMYSGAGQTVDKAKGVAYAQSVVTESGARRILEFAYKYGLKHKRKKMTIVHKANILKSTSGLFLDIGREVAKEYPSIETNEMIVDNCCMQLVMNPHQFDMIVTTNLFGDILSDLCAGLVGGLGLAPGSNLGDEMAIFEAVHGTAPDIAGKNMANPTSLLLAFCLLLDHLEYSKEASKLRNALRTVIKNKKNCTADLGGKGTTEQFTEGLVEIL